MSSSQTTPERELPWIPLLVGLVAGLALGLFIGWIVWPVEYTGATFMDMPQETRIEYVSAVADGYAIYSTSEAAVEAVERLAILGKHAPDELLAAIEYYRTPPQQNAVRVSNLVRLAAVLGVPVDAASLELATPPTYVAIGETPIAETANNAAAPTPIAAADEATVSPSAGQSSLLPWLAAFAAVVFVIGGVIMLSRVGRKNSSGQPLEADFGQQAAMAAPVSVPSAAPSTLDVEPYKRTGSSPVSPQDDYYLGEDDEGPPVQHGRLEDDFMPEMGDDWDEPDNEGEVDENLAEVKIERPPTEPSTSSIAASGKASSTLGFFTARFQSPASAFSGHTMQIKDPATGQNLGEFGLEINERNRALASSPEQVMAINAYLIDKAQPRSFTQVRRALLSEAAGDAESQQAIMRDGGENLRPFVAQPGVKFALEGPTLHLDCRIEEVRYDQTGAFSTLVVNMAVSRRNGALARKS